ncbi:MAG: GNAT family N-acetyltransferase [Pseudomonadota bacterium]
MNPCEIVKCFDKDGRPFEVEERSIDCLSQLMHMYGNFFPRAISQGLPPSNDVDLKGWVCKLLDSGWNFVCRQDGMVVGHAAVLPDLKKADGEYVVFVLQAYRNKGLGTVLTEAAMRKAEIEGLEIMWLTVEAFNFRAIKVYKKVGFEFCDECERERTMVLRL